MGQTKARDEAAVRWLSAQIRERVEEKYVNANAKPETIKALTEDIKDVIYDAEWLRELLGDRRQEEIRQIADTLVNTLFDIAED